MSCSAQAFQYDVETQQRAVGAHRYLKKNAFALPAFKAEPPNAER
jgi:hypothetical protein